MPRFRYVAMDAKGGETEGVLDAESQTQAVAMIRSKNFFPTRVVEIGGKSQVQASVVRGATGKGLSMDLKLPSFLVARVKTKQLMIFTRQLATLVEAGLPLLKALRILLKQEKHPALREALNGMGELVEGGSTFSESLAQYPKIFDNLFINMVKAGEAGGVLDQVLIRLAEFMEKAEKIKNKVKSAMIYPLVVLVAAVGILVFMLMNVIPKFAQIFDDLLGGAALPGLTKFVIDLSYAVSHRWYIILGTIVPLIIVIKIWGRTKTGSYVIDKITLKMPLFGQLFTKSSVSRFSRTLGTLMGSGVPVLQALNIVRDTAGNQVISKAIMKVHDSVKEGDTMAMPLAAAGVFPDMVVSMVDVGEETGALPEMLMKIADNYDDEVDTAVEGLTSIIEPVMIIMLAVVIGTIVLAMFVPLISIIGQMSA
ncbi:MAG: type II secretion system F family protein [Lentisphaerae bacterium]|nr:type II secretion system F family protein [Lentisphaerota bacterium]